MKCITGCGRETETEICPYCEIAQLEYDAEIAVERLIEAYRKLLEKEKQNAKCK